MGWSKLGCTDGGSPLISCVRAEQTTAGGAAVKRGSSPNDRSGVTERKLAKIGRYMIRGQLGSGGMGRVYRAHDLQLRRDVAIKVIRPTGDDARARALRERFVREGRALARLANPYVVGVIEVGQQDGMPYLVMEYVPGKTLHETLERSGPLLLPQAVRIGRKLALALAHAHDAGILHRDVKPSNVVLRPNGEPLLIDFGLARNEGSQRHLSRAGAMLGTPGFAAPEQLRGELDRIGRHSDIYGLGATLYAMLAGEIPDTVDPTPIDELVVDLDPELARICMACLSPDPAARPKSARRLANALARLSICNGHAVARFSLAQLVDEAEGRAQLQTQTQLPTQSIHPEPPVEFTCTPPEPTRANDRVVVVLALLLLLTTTALLVTWRELDQAWAEADRWAKLHTHPSASVRAAAKHVAKER